MKQKLRLFTSLLLLAVVSAAWGSEGDVHDMNISFSQLLNNNATIAPVTIEEQSYQVKAVTINWRYNKATENVVTIEVKVGGTSWGTKSVGTNTTADIVFEGQSTKGAIEISFTNNAGSGTGKGTFYVNSVKLTEGSGGDTPTPTNPTISFGSHSNVTLEMWYFDSDVVDINDGDEVAEGTEVFVKATPANGYVVERLTAVDANGTPITLTEESGAYSFYMPSSNVTISANAVEDGSYEQPTTVVANLNNSLFGTDYNGSASGITDDKPVSGTINNVTITYAGGGNHYINDSQIRFYPSNKLTFTAPEGYKITSIVFSSAGTWAATISADKGAYTDGNKTWSGSESTVVFTGSGSSRCDMSKATITLASADAVAAPVISGTTPFLGSTEVTITAEEGATIYYTTDDSTPTASSTQYSAPFSLEASATVKAIAVKGGKTSIVAEKAFEEATTMTVAQALAATAPVEGVYVEGIVSTVTEVSTEHGNATYRISDDGTTEGEMIVYRGKYLNNVNFTDINQIQVGDVVVVAGKLTEYNGANQLAAGNYIVTLTTKQEPGIAYETTEYTVAPSATFETPELTNPHNLAVTYSISENEGVASIDATTGAVTIGTEEGSVTVTATFAGNNQYRAGSASYIIRVSDPTKGTEANPYTVADVIAGKADGKTEIYVIGYIVGEFNSKTQDPRTSGFTTDANIALADEFTSTPTAAASIPVALPTSALKTEWGCKTNEGSTIGTQVLVKGNGTQYFSVNGIKETTEVTAVAIPVTISAVGMATFSSTKPLDFTGVEKIYAYTAQVDGSKVNFTRVYKVPANTGLLLRNPNGESAVAQVPVITEAEAETVNNNALVAVAETIERLATENENGGTNYILNKKGDNVGFYKANYQKVGAGKAYLHVPAGVGVREFIGFDEETDGIRQIKNGQLTIENAEIYNLSGQRVNKAQKGIYIVNGKKVVVK